MFLQVNEVGEEATYQLGVMTCAFVLNQSERLDHFVAVKERVAKYKSKFFPDNPILARLRDRVENLLTRGRRQQDSATLKSGLDLLMDASLSPKITEDPRFQCLLGFAYASQLPPRLEDARLHFGRAFAMSFEPDIEHISAWYYAERNSGHGLEQSLRIADIVCNGKRYDEDTKFLFLSRKATILFTRGRDNIDFDPSKGLADLEAALLIHLQCYERSFQTNSINLEKNEEYARNSAFVMFQFLERNNRFDDLIAAIGRVCEATGAKLDPIEDPIFQLTSQLRKFHGTRADANRLSNKIEQLRRKLSNSSKWFDRFANERIQKHLLGLQTSIHGKAKSK
jgi:hypothetical protein